MGPRLIDRRDNEPPPPSAPECYVRPVRGHDDGETRTDPVTLALVQQRARQVARHFQEARQ